VSYSNLQKSQSTPVDFGRSAIILVFCKIPKCYLRDASAYAEHCSRHFVSIPIPRRRAGAGDPTYSYILLRAYPQSHPPTIPALFLANPLFATESDSRTPSPPAQAFDSLMTYLKYISTRVYILVFCKIPLCMRLCFVRMSRVEQSTRNELLLFEIKYVVDPDLFNKFGNVAHQNHRPLILVERFC